MNSRYMTCRFVLDPRSVLKNVIILESWPLIINNGVRNMSATNHAKTSQDGHEQRKGVST